MLDWEAVTPSDSIIRFELRAAETKEGLDTATAAVVRVRGTGVKGSFDVADALSAAGIQKDQPHLRVTAVLKASSDLKVSPVLRGFELRYHCVFAE
jgi:hypothetical protein